ncbi:metalloregulator ArsR/SmtB family transcription factor [Georgenia daeguensis]|uniref:Metalloregulator ArsR/SmtB family transcription factor n=1 Tax=Georgenia daeguensis TaxID=908355 RepID=A0ABP8EVF0_9MICO
MEDVYRALADPTRRLILDELLLRDGQTLFEICGRLAMRHGSTSTRQAISQHLAVLEQAGLVRSHRDGRTKVHHLDTEPLRAIIERWPLDPPGE